MYILESKDVVRHIDTLAEEVIAVITPTLQSGSPDDQTLADIIALARRSPESMTRLNACALEWLDSSADRILVSPGLIRPLPPADCTDILYTFHEQYLSPLPHNLTRRARYISPSGKAHDLTAYTADILYRLQWQRAPHIVRLMKQLEARSLHHALDTALTAEARRRHLLIDDSDTALSLTIDEAAQVIERIISKKQN